VIKSILVSLLVIISLSSVAQDSGKKKSKEQKKAEKRERINAIAKQEEEGALIYAKQSIFGFQLRTNGYGGFYELAKFKTRRKSNTYAIEFTEIKDPKEEKSSANGFFAFNNPYVFGKVHNFYQLKLGFGQQYLLGQKGNKNGVAVALIYQAGFSGGFLRPYYLDVSDTSADRQIKFNPGNSYDSALFLNIGAIRGSSGLGKGWGEMDFKPGLYLKTALRFDYGRYNEVVSGVEIGVSVDVYSDKIPILLFAKDKQVFLQGHIAILFGRRKT
jgi:hypothetical protein